MSDIVDRLRDPFPSNRDAERREAADEIERLLAEVHKLSTTCGHCSDLEHAWQEVERLRTVLDFIARCDFRATVKPTWMVLRDLARNALKENIE